MQEKTIETKTCKHCNLSFEITDKDLEFYEKVSPTFNGKKYLITSPTLCSDCRLKSRLIWRNERKLYHRKSDFTGNQIISIYSPDKPYKVYEDNIWWSDNWNPLDYAKNFDFSKSFFEQFDELNTEIPKLNLVVFLNENSPYTNFVTGSKNVYMSGDIMNCENLYYSNMIKSVNNGVDLFDVQDSSICYECICSRNLTNCFYVNWSKNCYKSRYLYNCENVSESLFCTNIRNKKNYILNKESSKEEYEKVFELIKQNKHQSYLIEYEKLLLNTPRKNLKVENCENCSGELLSNSKNSFECYHSEKIENCKYVSIGQDMYYSMDTTIHNPECYLDYQAISGGKLKNAISNIFCWDSDNIYYSHGCFNCSNVFGCIGLRNKSYCILNKQYSREEYEILVPKIIEHMQKIGEWGEFFPAYISPFGYNETVAQEYFQLEKEDAIKLGFKWSDYEKQNGYNGEFYLPIEISNYNEKIVGKEISETNILKALAGIIKCEKTGKPFRLVKAELEFYIKNNIEIPKIHPDERHLDRLKLRNPRKLFDRKCDKCGKDIKTTYSPDRKEIVYCESCYLEII